MILGIASLVASGPMLCCCLVGLVQFPSAVTGIGLGIFALQRIKQGRATGRRSMAMAGIICGSLALLLTLGAVIMTVLAGLDTTARNPFTIEPSTEVEQFDLDIDFD